MTHPAVRTVIHRIEHDLIGGAADMARESADALGAAARESGAADVVAFREEIAAAITGILAVTPSIAPVTRVLHLVGRALEVPDGGLADAQTRVVQAASDFTVWLDQALAQIAATGAELVGNEDNIFTYSISSTVFRIIETARGQGKRVRLATTESRPGNEGLRTIPRMVAAGVPVTIGIDAAIGQLMRGCTWAVVGADTITAGGSALCKVGSFPTALVARHYGIPFRVVADTSKFDPATRYGARLVIREMPASDIVGEIPDASVTVRNPIFEMIPAQLISEIITEHGVLHPGGVAELMRDLPQSRFVTEMVERGLVDPSHTPPQMGGTPPVSGGMAGGSRLTPPG